RPPADPLLVTLVLVGLSHRVAPVELRERVALAPDEAAALARELGEAVCLSTCNRTEVYLATDEPERDEARSVDALAASAGVPGAELRPSLYRLRDEAAALHLFRVAAGLDSMVPGEGEILGQVRSAYETGAAGSFLDRLFRQALHAGKRVRAQTAIGENPVSVPAAAAALAEQVFGDLAGCRVLLVGAGRTAELAARSLVSRGASIAFVANRSLERAAELTGRYGGEALSLERVRDELVCVDVVVSSTSAPGVVLRREDVALALRRRKGRPLFLIDIAVPRDLDPAIHDVDGCYLYDIDDLESVAAEGLASRRAHAERAEEIRATELERARARLGRLSEADRLTVESLTAQIVNKLLHLPTVRMKEAAAGADGAVYANALRHLFDLRD